MIVIVDYGVGNLGSIYNMFKKIGIDAMVSSDIADIKSADKLILPGVGAFDTAMRSLQESGIISALHDKVIINKTPILGICLGMQLLAKKSEEGELPGLGWIDADVVKFSSHHDISMRTPHMGWNTVQIAKSGPLCEGMDAETKFYFVHSYHVQCREPSDVLMFTHYGNDFISAVQREHVMGVQFHPEKSHKHGMNLLRNFAEKM